MMSFIGTPLFWAGVSVMVVLFLLSVVLAYILNNQAKKEKQIAEKTIKTQMIL